MVKHKKTEAETQRIQSRAEDIARKILETEVDDRGDLLVMIADELDKSSQYYTSSLIRSAGRVYNRLDKGVA